MSSDVFTAGLSAASELFTAAHLARHADASALEKRAGLVAALMRTVQRKKQDQKPPVVKTASTLFPVSGVGAAAGGALGALVGGARRVMQLNKLVAHGVEGKAARDAALALHAGVAAKVAKNPKYIRSAAEHAAHQDVEFIAKNKHLWNPTKVTAPGAVSGGAVAPSLLDHVRTRAPAYAGSVARHAAGWGAGGALAGHGIESGLKAYKQKRVMDVAKKWALPAAAGLVGTKILLSSN